MYKCSKCGKEFETGRQYAGHTSQCGVPKIKCDICGKLVNEYLFTNHTKAHESDHLCLQCGKRIPKSKKFCNSSCAATYNNKQKEPRHKHACLNCGKMYATGKNSAGQFCSMLCSAEYKLKKNDERYFAGKISSIQTLKRHYLYHNENKCSLCGLTSWQGKSIVLVLDHIDGNSRNNSPDNLRLVCPNCDSQLDTYKGRNKGKGRFARKQRYDEGKSY